ncbi:hypothetical protein [Chryseobacterium sp. FH1]|uniref:hypothetical protein n=1 Tax=Chryseobacterium sp. FH1 TaxID=1233951 RepID=UPI0004E41737|nr:hypothetical protein [Chryseobacterium sp. FH1]KFC18275.1 hypothetical protein IO90_18830 [Chryseobacterium sp. FH1]
MKKTFNLAKSTLVFYAFIAPFIIGGSLYNLVYGLMLGEKPTVRIGVFSLLGFVVLPILLISTYLRNRVVVTGSNVQINKTDFPRSEYDFAITERYLPLKERPLFSLFRKIFHTLAITKKSDGTVVFYQDLETSRTDAKEIQVALES